MAKVKEMETRITLSGVMSKSVAKACSDTALHFQKLNKKLATLEKSVAIVGAAMATALVGTMAVASKKVLELGQQFDQAQNIIRIGTGSTGKALEDLMQSYEKVYATLPLGSEAIAAAIADINTLTGAQGTALEEFAHRALDAADMLKIDAKQLYTAAAQSFNAYGIAAEDMADKLDFVWKVSQSTGTSMTELMTQAQRHQATFQQLGYSYEQAVALLGQLDKVGFETSDAMAAMQRAVANLTQAGVKDLDTGVRNIFEHIQSAKTETEAITIAMKVFGSRGGAKMAKAIRDGSISVDNFTETMMKSTETIDKAADETDTLGDKWKEFQHHIEVGLRPAAQSLFDGIKQLIPVLDQLAQNLLPVIQEKAQKLGAYIQRGADAFKEWASVNITVEALRERVNGLVAGAKSVYDWFTRNKKVFETTGKVLLGLYATIKAIQVATVLWKTALIAWGAAAATAKGITAAWNAALAAGKAIMIAWNVATKAVTAAQWLFNAALWANPIGLVIAAVVALIAAVWLLVENWDEVCAWCKDAWLKFAEAFPQTAQFLKVWWTFVCDFYKGLWDGICKYISLAWDAVKTGFLASVEWFKNVGIAIKDAFCAAWDGLKSFVLGVIEQIKMAIQPIIEAVAAIKEGLTGALDKLKNSKINPANWDLFAAGGFTSGPAICGESGTEAVISFDPAYRKENQQYLMTAAEMLGMSAKPATSSQTTYNLGGITFSPVIRSGDGPSGAILEQLRACMPELVDMIETAIEERRNHRYV